MQGTHMLLEAKRWLQHAYPFWNRTGGRDHVWLVSHDEGSCWVPGELRRGTILSHWGRKVCAPSSEVLACENDAFCRDSSLCPARAAETSVQQCSQMLKLQRTQTWNHSVQLMPERKACTSLTQEFQAVFDLVLPKTTHTDLEGCFQKERPDPITCSSPAMLNNQQS